MRRILYVLPAVGMASVLAGSRITQHGEAKFARIESGPRGGNAALTFQIEIAAVDGDFRTLVKGLPIVVHAVYEKETARKESVTNAEGVAEVSFEFFGAELGRPLELIVTDGTNGEMLVRATGSIWQRDSRPAEAPRFIQATKREGDLALDVVLEGGMLAPSVERKAWIRVRRDETLVGGASINVEGDEVDLSRSVDLCAPGWGRFLVTSRGLAPTLRARATLPGGAVGSWDGNLPQMPGAGGISGLMAVPPDATQRIEVISASERDLFYLEVNDERGRAFATSVKLNRSGNELRGVVELPPLSRGRHWLSLSGEKDADTPPLFSPFFVAPTRPSCGEEAELSAVSPPARTRRLFANSEEEVLKRRAKRRSLGRTVAVLGLSLTGMLEFLLVRQELKKNKATKSSFLSLALVALGFVLLVLLVLGR